MFVECNLKKGPVSEISSAQIGKMDSFGEQIGRDVLGELILARKVRRKDLFSEGLVPKTPLEVERDLP